MQHYRENEKKQLKMIVSHSGFYFSKISQGLTLCESLHFVLYEWSSYFVLILECVNFIKLLKFKMAIFKLFAPKSLSGN